MEGKSAIITDNEYLFPENLSTERLRTLLIMKKIIGTERNVKHKEDLITLFNKYLRPLPQRSKQLKRESSKRGTQYMLKSRELDKTATETEKGEKEEHRKCHKQLKTNVSVETQSKPIKLKRKHSEQEKESKEKQRDDRHDDRRHEEKKSRYQEESSREHKVSSHKDKDSKSSKRSDSTDHDKVSLKDSHAKRKSDDSRKDKKDDSLYSKHHSSKDETFSKKHESKEKDADRKKHKKHKVDLDRRDDSPTKKARTDDDSKKEKFSRITWP